MHEIRDLEELPYLYKEEDEEERKEGKSAEAPQRVQHEKKSELHAEVQIRKSGPLPLVAEAAHAEEDPPMAAKAAKQQVKNLGKEEKSRYGIIFGICLIIIVAAIGIVYWKGSSPAPQGQNQDVAGEVNGEKITQQEIDDIYAQARAQFPEVTREQVLQQKIEEIVLLQEARRKGIAADESAVQQRVETWLGQLRTAFSEEQLQQRLQSQGITLEELTQKNAEILRKQSVINALIHQEVLQKESVLLPERVRASHILVENESEALGLKKEIDAGADFGEIAAQKSIDPSAALNQGELGYFTRGQMVPEFEDAAFAGKAGEIVGPVHTQFGFHLIRIEGVQPSSLRNAANLTAEEQQMVMPDLQAILQQYVARLRNVAVITLFGAPAAPPSPQVPEKKPEGSSKDGELVSVVSVSKETFREQPGAVCAENGLPVIRMFSAADCEQCVWIADTFDAVMQEYVGRIVAHRWELGGDDKLSAAVEQEVPAAELAVLDSSNPSRSVPTFVFGCRYVRIGNGYSQENDLGKEAAEFRAVVEKLV